MIHPTAIIDPEAYIDQGVEIGPYCILEKDVKIQEGCKLAAHVVLRSGTRLGKCVSVDSFAVIGGLPQSLGMDPKVISYVEVGDHTILREGVTIHRATQAGSATTIGTHCFMMNQAHIGHDSQVGNHCILGAQMLAAGHVMIQDYVNISGAVGIHQFIVVGEGAILGGHASISKNVPPFVVAANRNYTYGINSIGLKRRGLTSKVLINLKECYHFMYEKPAGSFRERAQEGLKEGIAKHPQSEQFLTFFTKEYRHKGIIAPESTTPEDTFTKR